MCLMFNKYPKLNHNVLTLHIGFLYYKPKSMTSRRKRYCAFCNMILTKGFQISLQESIKQKYIQKSFKDAFRYIAGVINS